MKISESKNILLIKLCLLVAQNQTSMKTFSVFIFTLITTYVHNVQLDLQEFILQIFFELKGGQPLPSWKKNGFLFWFFIRFAIGKT